MGFAITLVLVRIIYCLGQNFDYDLDYVHSFLVKPQKLLKGDRVAELDSHIKSGNQNVRITLKTLIYLCLFRIPFIFLLKTG